MKKKHIEISLIILIAVILISIIALVGKPKLAEVVTTTSVAVEKEEPVDEHMQQHTYMLPEEYAPEPVLQAKDVFISVPRQYGTSNVVGYMFKGKYLIEVPDWISQNWFIKDIDANTVAFTLRSDVMNRDFSDIIFSIEPKTATITAQSKFGTESGYFNAEVFSNKASNLLVYHIQKKIGQDVQSVFYLDAKEVTGAITFTASSTSYFSYLPSLRELAKSFKHEGGFYYNGDGFGNTLD